MTLPGVRCEIADLGIVSVDDERGVRGQLSTASRQRSAICSSSPYRSSWSRNRLPRHTACGRTRRAMSGRRPRPPRRGRAAHRAPRGASRRRPRRDSRPSCCARASGEERGSRRRARRSSSSRSSPRRSPCPGSRAGERAESAPGRSWPGSCPAASFLRRDRRGATAGPPSGRARLPGPDASGGQSSADPSGNLVSRVCELFTCSSSFSNSSPFANRIQFALCCLRTNAAQTPLPRDHQHRPGRARRLSGGNSPSILGRGHPRAAARVRERLGARRR